MKNQYRFTPPPQRLVRPGIQFENFALVTGDLLADIGLYQALSDHQPKGTALLVLPSPASPLRSVFAAIAEVLREKGKRVRLYSAH